MMNELTFVCPPDKKLISKIKDKKIVVVVDHASEIQSAVDVLSEVVTFNPVHALWVNDPQTSISDIMPQENWNRFHLSLHLKSLGEKIVFLENMKRFTALNVRFYLPISNIENIVSIQMITSLGFHTGMLFAEKLDEKNIEMLTDLCYYNKYMKACQGTIEPFNHIKGNYIEKSGFNLVCDIGELYYASPDKFIHVGTDGNLSVCDIFGHKTALGLSLEHWTELANNDIYRSLLEEQKQHFLQQTQCSRCSTWRICLGKFNNTPMQQYCETFFDNILYA